MAEIKDRTTITVERKDANLLKQIALKRNQMYFKAFSQIIQREAKKLGLI